MTNENTKQDLFISVTLVLEKDNELIFEKYLRSVHTELNENFNDFEILVVQQSNSYFDFQLKTKVLKTLSSIRWIQLAYKVDFEISLLAGLENSIGDYCILLRPGLDPIFLITDLIKKCEDGYEYAVGIANQPTSLGYRFSRIFARWTLPTVGYNLPRNATWLRCLNRRTINNVLSSGNNHQHLFVRIDASGYSSISVNYSLEDNVRVKKKTFLSGLKSALSQAIFNSTKPLRWMSILGIIGSSSAFIFTLYSIIINFFKDDVIEGWTSMVFFSSFLFTLLFIILAISGEYLARLLNERDGQSKFHIADEKNSSVMLDLTRLNIQN